MIHSCTAWTPLIGAAVNTNVMGHVCDNKCLQVSRFLGNRYENYINMFVDTSKHENNRQAKVVDLYTTN